MTDQELAVKYPWTLHRKWIEQQLQATDTIASSLPCMCDGCTSSRRKRWLKEMG